MDPELSSNSIILGDTVAPEINGVVGNSNNALNVSGTQHKLVKNNALCLTNVCILNPF